MRDSQFRVSWSLLIFDAPAFLSIPLSWKYRYLQDTDDSTKVTVDWGVFLSF